MSESKVRSQRRSHHKRGELLFVVVLMVLSAAALWQAYTIAGFSKWSSPGVFPMLAAGTMLVSAVIIFRDTVAARATNPQAARQVGLPILPGRVATMTALLLLYVLAMPVLGFIVTSGLFLLASISVLWRKPIWLTILVSGGSLAAIYVIFRIVFQVVLPRGTLITSLFQ